MIAHHKKYEHVPFDLKITPHMVDILKNFYIQVVKQLIKLYSMASANMDMPSLVVGETFPLTFMSAFFHFVVHLYYSL